MGFKVVQRRVKVIELTCAGLTEIQIAAMLGISERTVRRDLKSAQAQDFVEELIRRQLRDIAESDDAETRMKYRQKLLDKLIHKIGLPKHFGL